MKLCETIIAEGPIVWGEIQVESIKRQTIRVLARPSGASRFIPVFEMTVIDGKLAFATISKGERVKKEGRIVITDS